MGLVDECRSIRIKHRSVLVMLKFCSFILIIAAMKKTGIPEPFAVFPTNVCLPRQTLMGSYFLGCLSAQLPPDLTPPHYY